MNKASSWNCGVDGCQGGWFVVALLAEGPWRTSLEPDFQTLWERWKRARRILVDIPIGLQGECDRERKCDLEARRLLGRRRSSSVFPVPCREATNASSYSEACRINEQLCGRKLSKQSWNILPKIRQVDNVLQTHPAARRKVAEIHPEVLFSVLKSKQPLYYSKRTDEGHRERFELLKKHCPAAETIVQESLAKWRRSVLARDDILDALVAAVVGTFGKGRLRSLPSRPRKDPTGLPMRIVYPEIQ